MSEKSIYGTAEELAAIIVSAAESFDIEDGAPDHFYVQFSKSDGWEVEFSVDNVYEMSMTRWDTGDDVTKVFNAIKTGDETDAEKYAADVLGGWEPEWDQE